MALTASISQAEALVIFGDIVSRPKFWPCSAAQRSSRTICALQPQLTSAPSSSYVGAYVGGLTLEPAEVLQDQKVKSSMIILKQDMKSMMTQEKMEMFESLQGWAEENVLPYLKPVEKSWQPQDYLPEASGEGFEDELRELRRRCRELPADYLVCLVGDMITEEALPTYHSLLNSLDGVYDETGISPSPWARWIRSWTAEENRHGDLLHKYLYLSGRVDMRSIQKTIHYLISGGMDRKVEDNPYLGFIYTSFQERATFISHGNTARQAKQFGDTKLAQICGIIASDEKRHENAYQKIVEKLFELDPNGTMLCFEDMMRKRISMPARLMYDGCDENLYDKFSLVTQRTGVYTARDYADILEYLIRRWKVDKQVGLSSRGQQAQDYVCSLAARVRKVEERSSSQTHKRPRTSSFAWIFNNEVALV